VASAPAARGPVQQRAAVRQRAGLPPGRLDTTPEGCRWRQPAITGVVIGPVIPQGVGGATATVGLINLHPSDIWKPTKENCHTCTLPPPPGAKDCHWRHSSNALITNSAVLAGASEEMCTLWLFVEHHTFPLASVPLCTTPACAITLLPLPLLTAVARCALLAAEALVLM
jgi:hypothetical protein